MTTRLAEPSNESALPRKVASVGRASIEIVLLAAAEARQLALHLSLFSFFLFLRNAKRPFIKMIVISCKFNRLIVRDSIISHIMKLD